MGLIDTAEFYGPGTSSVAHLEDNLAAAALRLTDDEFQLLDSTEAG